MGWISRPRPSSSTSRSGNRRSCRARSREAGITAFGIGADPNATSVVFSDAPDDDFVDAEVASDPHQTFPGGFKQIDVCVFTQVCDGGGSGAALAAGASDSFPVTVFGDFSPVAASCSSPSRSSSRPPNTVSSSAAARPKRRNRTALTVCTSIRLGGFATVIEGREPTAGGRRLQGVGGSGGDGECHSKRSLARGGLFGVARLAILDTPFGWRLTTPIYWGKT